MARTPKARLEIPPDTEANVIQKTDHEGRTTTQASFKAQAIPDDDSSSNEVLGGESDFESVEESTYEALPATPLDRLFSDIRIAAAQTRKPMLGFYAYIVRQPDALGVHFIRPCNYEIDFGAFQFSIQDQYQFNQEIQKRNGNSGGFFNVRILGADRARMIVQDDNLHVREVGLTNYFVPDPFVEPDAKPNGTMTPDNLVAQVLAEMRQERAEFMQALQQQQARENQPRDKSTLEKAIEEKILRDLINPPPPANDPMNNAMAQMFVMPQIADRWAKRMFPDPPEIPPPVEPDFFDKLEKFSTSRAGQMLLPAAMNLASNFGETAQAYFVHRMRLNDSGNLDEVETSGQQQMHAANPGAPKTEMQELIELIIGEIESDRVLDAENEFLSELRKNYPSQSDMLISTCETLPFPDTLAFLMNMARKMQPSPFMPFVDVEASQKAKGQIIWNERGERAKARLAELHAYLKTLNA